MEQVTSAPRELALVDPSEGSDLLFELICTTAGDARMGMGIVSVLRNVSDLRSATEEIEVEYGSEPLDIGFNSRYLLDIAAQLEGEAAVLKLADPGSPTLIQDRDTKGALYVLMPMRV